MEQKQMNPNRIQLGWFNAWVGLIWIYMLIKTLLYFFNQEYYLETSFNSVKVSHITTEITKYPTRMTIDTNKGKYFYYNRDNFSKIEETIQTNKDLLIYFDKDDNSVVDFIVNDKLLLGGSLFANILYLIGLLFSALVTTLSVILLIKTKGWGTYDLLEKHRQKKKLKK